ncbi:MAG TPA: ATP-binding cassette domain-containing protein [Candidatus Blautia faecipullorum]|nr:ATP-binding cassette domain-containing protein [Candidatus Blautia faecipullorum]
MKNNPPLLEVRDLKMYFRSGKDSVVKAVDGVSFRIDKGKVLGLVGESGCGKTTIGKSVLKIYNPTGGEVLYKGKDILKMSKGEFKKYRRSLQMIFQDPYSSIDPRQSVFSILKEAVLAGGAKMSTGELKDKVNGYLETVGLPVEMGNRYPHEMSGGQRQRLGIGRALACEPELIVCDEPVSALDVSIQAQIINLFQRIQKDMGYLFIAHDLAVVRHIADVVGVMYLGHLVEMMDSEGLYANPMHPYTIALLSAIPITDYYKEKQRKRIILQGEVPSPLHAPSGCPFHPRCRYATEECRRILPELKDMGAGHMVACHNVEKIAD